MRFMLLLLVCDFADILQSKINDSFVFMMRNTILVHPVGTNDPFLHHKLLLREYSLGNCLGHYLEAYSCAMVANIGFNLEIVPHERLSNCTLKIISMLPTNPHPTTIVSDYQESKLQQICSCHKYCWETSNSAWFHALDTIHQILKRAFNTIPFYRCTDHKVENATRPDIQTWNKKYGVTIQYRCSDILSLKEKKYGFVNFHVYSFLIPSNTKEVMILSDHPNRSHEGAICGSIIDALGAFLQVEFPLASIQVQRGGDVMEAMLMLAQSHMTICSSSTFCFWAALGSKGTAYFPASKLIAGGNITALRDKLLSPQHFKDVRVTH